MLNCLKDLNFDTQDSQSILVQHGMIVNCYFATNVRYIQGTTLAVDERLDAYFILQCIGSVSTATLACFITQEKDHIFLSWKAKHS